jgi:hypothetical protein
VKVLYPYSEYDPVLNLLRSANRLVSHGLQPDQEAARHGHQPEVEADQNDQEA